MQCSVSNLSRLNNTRPICRYDTPIERRVFKRLNTKRTRRVCIDDVLHAAQDDHLEAEVTVSKPRMYGHVVNCDCVLCSRL